MSATSVPGTRRRPQQRRSQETYDTILDVAAQLVERAGPDTLTTTAVADRAGLSVGSLYQYFESVDAIVDALIERHLAAFSELVEETVAGTSFASADEAGLALVHAFADYYRSEAGFRRMWTSPPVAARFKVIREANDNALVDLMKRLLVENGLVTADDPELETSILVRWSVSEALLDLAFRLDSDGDQRVLTRLDRLLGLESWSE
jgi:AcrR family transcriptional regulator